MWTRPKCGRTFVRKNQSHYCGGKPSTIHECISRKPEDARQELERMRDILRSALPIHEPMEYGQVLVPDDAYVAMQEFNVGGKASPFETAGAMQDFVCATAKVVEDYHGPRKTLGDVLIPEKEVPDSYFVPKGQQSRWQYLKGSKHEPFADKRTGHEYFYSEGGHGLPRPAREPEQDDSHGRGSFRSLALQAHREVRERALSQARARRARPAAYVPEELDRYGDDRQKAGFSAWAMLWR